jgi:hypothetical protein
MTKLNNVNSREHRGSKRINNMIHEIRNVILHMLKNKSPETSNDTFALN